MIIDEKQLNALDMAPNLFGFMMTNANKWNDDGLCRTLKLTMNDAG